MNRELKAQIIVKAKQLGINKIGFTHALPFEGLEAQLKEQKEQGFNSGFEHPIIEERVNPAKIFDQPQSIIAIGLAYPSKSLIRPERRQNQPRGEFARASWGRDYHYILEDKMAQLIEYIKQVSPEFGVDQPRFKPMVDTGELVDVAVATRAGLGFTGKNGLLITKEYGSYLYIGQIVTNIAFSPDDPVDYDCGECRRCIDACPTQALLGDGSMNAKLCLSYQTQTKGFLNEEFRQKIGRVIYGCDICQIVCPYNLGKDSHFHPEMESDPDTIFPELKPMLTLSNRLFRDQFGHLAGSWRGKKPLQRNAIIALANYQEISAIPELLKLIEEDPRPVIRGTAAWAIGKIMKGQQNQELITFLIEAVSREEDQDTIDEFHQAIELIAGSEVESKIRQ